MFDRPYNSGSRVDLPSVRDRESCEAQIRHWPDIEVFDRGIRRTLDCSLSVASIVLTMSRRGADDRLLASPSVKELGFEKEPLPCRAHRHRWLMSEYAIDLQSALNSLYKTKDDRQAEHQNGDPECIPLYAVTTIMPPLQ
jgi:hypothetical protein